MARTQHGFGTSSADVRIHAQSDLPRRIAADAFTTGSHLSSAPGGFQAGSRFGEPLLTHDSAHVVQQGASRIARRVGEDDHGAATSSTGEGATSSLAAHGAQEATHAAHRVTVGNRVRIARRFNQTAVGAQTEHFNGVTATYDAAANFSDLHIAPGANDDKTMGQDALRALWAIREELQKGEARAVPVAGRFEMHPQGAVVVKDTMEMLAEALGAGPSLGLAQTAKAGRKAMGLPLTQSKMSSVVDAQIVTEHMHYRDSLVGSGISMGAVGGPGMGGGAVDMLDATPANALAAANVRAAYDAALLALRPLSLTVSMTLPQLNVLIADLEANAGAISLALLRTKHYWSY